MARSQIDQTSISGDAAKDEAVVELVRLAVRKAVELLDAAVPDIDIDVGEVRLGVDLDLTDPAAADALARLIAVEALESAAKEQTDLPPVPGDLTTWQGKGVTLRPQPLVGGGARRPHAVELDVTGGVRGKLTEAYRRQHRDATLPKILKKVKSQLLPRTNLYSATLTLVGSDSDRIELNLAVGHDKLALDVVSVDSDSTLPRGPHGTGGSESGPVRFTPSMYANNRMVGGTIHVDENLHNSEIGRALGHEIDELAGILKQGALTAEALRREMRAEFLRKREGKQKPKQPTAHDVATAHELNSAWWASRDSAKSRLSQAGISSPSLNQVMVEQVKVLEGKLRAWGLLDVDQHLGSRLDFLTQEIPVEMLAELFEGLHFRAHPTSLFKSKTFRHLLHPSPTLDNARSYVYGGHVEGPLVRFADAHPELVLIETGRKPVAGLELKKFAQLKYKGGGKKPAPKTPDYPVADPSQPAGVRYDPAKWDLAQHPKSTVDDLRTFLEEAETAWDKHAAGGSPVLGPDGEWDDTSANGVPVAGYTRIVGTGYDVASVFPNAAGI